jgi:hypothetical protein
MVAAEGNVGFGGPAVVADEEGEDDWNKVNHNFY